MSFLLNWIKRKLNYIIFGISMALHNTEIDILKADPNNLDEKDKKTTRKLHRNPVLEKFYAGQRDEKYVQDYYEILKKSDEFIKNSTPRQIRIAADRHGSNYGKEDLYGEIHEHFGFFDFKHKNNGKTINEVIKSEIIERRTNDDEYELEYIFNNRPIEVGFSKVLNVIENIKENDKTDYNVFNSFDKSKQFEFPIKIYRSDNQNISNKIEELTEFLHIKKIGFEYKQLEFFIPLKFKTNTIDIDSNIFNEIVNIKNVYIRNEYGKLLGYNVIKFIKRIIHNDMYDVLKFETIEMERINLTK